MPNKQDCYCRHEQCADVLRLACNDCGCSMSKRHSWRAVSTVPLRRSAPTYAALQHESRDTSEGAENILGGPNLQHRRPTMPFVTHSALPILSTFAEHEQASSCASSEPSSRCASGCTSRPSQTPKRAGPTRTASSGSCA